ncbi:MAG TPA: acetate--CoA ligase family protein [Acidimicrobiales bacterium]|nr:acetate--CoA ligase family protein [Acidimicrobiales bacterium]
MSVTAPITALRDVDLDRFFRPRRVVVIGASDTERKPNTALWRKVRTWGEARGAEVFPVNPNRETIDGLPCASSIHEIDGDLDLVAILVGDVMPAMQDVIDRKAAFAVIFAAGFSEVGKEGEKLQATLETMIAAGDTHVLGPNTNLNAFEVYNESLPGRRLALITQSGHQGRPIYQAHEELGIAMSHWAPVGNEADLEFADFVKYFADQDGTGVIAAYIEGFKDGRTLMLAADHAAQRRVPIVCVKVGRTDEGRSMAKAHTGHLTGADAVVSSVFRQYGITRVDGLDELTETSALLARAGAPAGDGVCVYAISGGTGAHMADLCAAAGLRLPDLTKKSQKALHEWIPSYLRVSNPVDNGGAPSGDWRGRKILDAIVADANVDLIICPITGALPSMANQLCRDLADVSELTDKPLCVIWGSPTYDSEAYKTLRAAPNLIVFHTFGNCVRAVKAYLDYHSFLARYRSPKFATKVKPRELAAGALDEFESKQLLSEYGITVSRDILCSTPKEAVAAAKAIGFPVVVKACSAKVLHKARLGLVKIGLTTPEQVKAAASEILRHAKVDAVLVSEVVEGGVETVIGVAQDELFGPTVMFGLGGVFVEVLKEVTFRVPPFSKDEAKRMVTEVRGASLIPAVGPVVDAIMKVQKLALECGDSISELDVNPLLARKRDAVALDALVVGR